MKGAFKITKDSITEYLFDDFRQMAQNKAFEVYELPEKQYSKAYYEINRMVMESEPNFVKDLIKNSSVFNKFLKILEKNFANNGQDSFAYTCRCSGETGVFAYHVNPKDKWEKVQNKEMNNAFGNLLDQWAEHYADWFVTCHESWSLEQQSIEKNKELEELNRLAKKHGKKLI